MVKRVVVSVVDPVNEAVDALKDGVTHLDINMVGKDKNATSLKAVSEYPYLQNGGFKKIVAALQNNETCVELDLSGNHISGGTAIAKFAKVLAKNSTLQRVNFSYNDLTSADVEHLAKSLERNNTLTELVLSNNKITNAGAVQLAKSLRNNVALKKLYLSNNQVKDDGAEALAWLLSNGYCPLDTIALNFNSIRNRGAKVLMRALMDNDQLVSVGLAGNKISKRGSRYAQKLFDSRIDSQEGGILYLSLDHNRISATDYQELENKALKARTELTKSVIASESGSKSAYSRITSFMSRDRVKAYRKGHQGFHFKDGSEQSYFKK